VDRRAFITLVGGSVLALPLPAQAQPPGKIWRIGLLADAPPAKGTATDFWTSLIEGLRALGYSEGENMAILPRYAEGNLDRLRDFATELVSLKVNVILAVATGAALAAKMATNTIPIIFMNVADPLGPGLVTSLARPGGNITGLSSLVAELGGKRLALLKEALPAVSHVAVLWNASKGNTGGPYTFRQTETAGLKLGLRIQSLAVIGPSELDRAFEAASRNRAGAVLVQDGPHFLSAHATQIVDLATKRPTSTGRLAVPKLPGGRRTTPQALRAPRIFPQRRVNRLVAAISLIAIPSRSIRAGPASPGHRRANGAMSW